MATMLLKAQIHPDLLDKMGGVDMGIGSIYQIIWGRHNKSKYILVSPLHVAVTHGHIALINVLLEYGANIDILAKTDIFSKELRVPPIFWADSKECTEALIQKGANFLLVPKATSVTVLQQNIFLVRIRKSRL